MFHCSLFKAELRQKNTSLKQVILLLIFFAWSGSVYGYTLVPDWLCQREYAKQKTQKSTIDHDSRLMGKYFNLSFLSPKKNKQVHKDSAGKGLPLKDNSTATTVVLEGAKLVSQTVIMGMGPCDCAERWEEGGHWDLDAMGNPLGTITEKGSIPDPQGIIRCGNAADTESGLTPCIDPGNNTDQGKCNEICVYDPATFTIDLTGAVCFDPNNLGGPPVNPEVPAPGCPVTWLQFDVRHLAGTWQFQIVTGSIDIGWALYATTAPTNDGTGGDCSSLELQECGIEFSNTWSTITTPEFAQETNYYLAFWGRGAHACDYVSLNFKARNGCGEAGCYLAAMDTTVTCHPDGSYTVEVCFDAVNGVYYITDSTGQATSIIETPPGLEFGTPGDTGCVELTYPFGVDYNFTIAHEDDTCALNFQGPFPNCHQCMLDVTCPQEDQGFYACLSEVPGIDTSTIIRNDSCYDLRIEVEEDTTGSGCGMDTMFLTRRYIIIDDDGDPTTVDARDTCIQIYRILDEIGPMIFCPINLTIDCSASTDTSNTGSAFATDNCGPVTLGYVDFYSGSCPETLTRSWIATDGCGNTATCDQIITLVDNTPPTLTLPADVTVDCNAPTDPNSTGLATATDDCNAVTITFSDSLYGLCPEFIERTWTATDDCNNSSSGVQIITILDNTPPVIEPPFDLSIDCNASTDTSNTGVINVTDDCHGVTIAYSDITTGSCPELLSRTWTATDECGNVAIHVQFITIIDNTPPVITCPAGVIVDCNDSTDPTNTGEATATDDCNGVSISYSDVSTGACPEVLNRTWTATDDCGNTSSCVQTITINDNTPPVITCPADVTIDCNESINPLNTGEPTATDDCSGISFSYADVSAGQCPEVITRTWTATDDCGNSSTCIQSISLEDNTAPVIVCPADVSIDCQDPTDPTNTGEATATDDCNGVVITFSDVRGGDCPEVITRTWLATDDCGNTSTCAQSISIQDNTPPVISCPNNITVDCQDPTSPTFTGSATATDDCHALTIAFTDVNSGNCPETIERTWSATDDCGNVSTCIQTITIEDTTPPVITCPADVMLNCGDPTDPMSTGEATATDDCSGVTVTFSDVRAGSCPEVITRTWSAEDGCGNVSTCNQVITLEDNQAPTIACPADVTVDCSDPTDPTNTGEATATDDCSGVVITFSDVTAGMCPEVITRTWQAEDICGNIATCVQTITIEDNTPPVITCPADVSVDCLDPTDPTNTGEATATDGCSNVSISHTDVLSGSCPEIITRTWSAEDDCGNVSSCIQVITIEDNTPPVITCPADVSIDCQDPTDPTNTGEATATDDCHSVSISYTDVRSGSCPEIITRTWSATDDCGNVSTCIQTITIEDTTPPVITCPADVMLNCGDPTDPMSTGEATATDDCSGVTVTFSDVRAGSCPEVITRTWSAEDGCGNVSTCNQVITLEDNQAPTITCPADVTVDCGDPTDPSNTGEATATDDCSGVVITFSDITAGMCPEVITRTWQAEDICGNIATCVQTITIEDNTPPVITCPADVSVDCQDPTDPSNTGEATATDDCSNVSISHTDVLSGSCPEVITRTWTAEDDCGNVSSCIQVITIEDNTPPVITCPADVSIDCQDPTDPTNTGEATATDDCHSVSISYTDVRSGSCPEIITRTWSATDDCGNVSTCIQTITIEDTTPPVITCPADVMLNCGDPTDPMSTGEATATDDCSGVTITFTDVRAGSCPEVITRTWRAEDGCGNISTCNQVITLEDNQAPTITCPADVTVDCSDPTDPSNTGEATATDDCSGVVITFSDVTAGMCPEVITRTWQAEDICGNIATCVQTITIEDNTPPVITCPADVSVDCQDPTDPSNTGEATATDDCSNVSISNTDVLSGSCPEVITRTWSAEDDCGNVSSCIQVITIEDNTPPVITCPADVSIDCQDPTDPTNTGEATATDDCHSVSISYSDVRSGSCPEIITRTWSATDDCGNVSTCVQTITIEDTTPPVITCPADVMLNCGDPTDPMSTGEATATDDCSSVTITFTDVRAGSCPEVITRTWSAEDGCGNVSTCNQVITLEDNQAPTITCPADVTIDCSDPTDPTNTGEATATDDCSGVVITFSDITAGMCPEVITRTWQAEDICGNIATCVQTITIVDNTPPVINCPTNRNIDCGDSTDPSNTGEATASDDCFGVTIAYSDVVSGMCPEVITRTWTAEDDCGNIATCVQTISLFDNTPPVINCPADVSIDCQDPTDPTNTGEATATDDCHSVVISYTDVTAGNCPEIITRTWLALDDCGNASTCNQTITIIDDTPPVITCPADVILTCLDPTDPTNTGEATATDDCGSVSITFSDSRTGQCPEVIERTWTATDDCGNTSSCVQRIEINDTTPPIIACPDNISVSCDEPIDPTRTGEATATDDCSSVTITFSDVSVGMCPEIITRTWMAEDLCGNVATCMQLITIVDNTPPVINCPADISLTCLDSTDPNNTGEATATDICSTPTITYTDATAGMCPEVITRTWSAEDDCGNVATCVQVISIVDDTPPTLNCPANVNVNCGDPTDPANTGEATAMDDCSTPTITFSDVTSGMCPEVITRTWTAEDDCGNVATCVQTITVSDDIPPVITCPADVNIDCSDPTDPTNTGEATATDNCSTVVITFTDANSGNCPVVISRTWQAEDDCGNVATCVQTITVNDDTPPVITCPGNVSLSCGDPTDPTSTGEATATDDCSSVTITYTDNTTGGCTQIIERTWTAEDDCGNVATCVQTITLTDDTPPVITCPANVNVSCTDPTDPTNTGEATATDDCSGVTITFTDVTAGMCPEVIARTWRAEDDCGNVATCVQTITVNDDQPPVITCPADVRVGCGDPTFPTLTGFPTATDDCSGVTVTYSDVLSGDCPEILSRTWQAEDDCGNIATCVQTITIADDVPPVITCPSNVNLNCGDPTDPTNTGEATATDDCSSVTITFTDVTSGDCPEVITRTWEAEDDCGNVATCVQTITINDNQPPVITCPGNVSLSCGDPTDPTSTGEATATDDCSSVTITYSDNTTGACTQIIERTWMAEDDCGNVATCVQTITLTDDTPPVITCPANLNVSCTDPTDPTNTGEATATDDCSGVTITFTDVTAGMCPEVITRTWRAEDDCGNVATCVQTITVNDDQPPVITCPADVNVNCGDPTFPTLTGFPTATDDCSGVTVTYSDVLSGDCPEILSRTWQAEDDCGNIATCVQTITIADDVPPVITCPANVNLNCGDPTDPTNTGEATATDDCSTVTITFTDVTSGDCPEVITRTWEAEDDCGNVATCVQTITINDNQPPVITCPGNVSLSCGDPTDPTSTGEATATDDCSSVTITYTDNTTGGCTQTIERTWTAEDDCGNVATCVQTITLTDDTPPVITCPGNVSLSCGDPTDPTNTGEATATDDCSGVTITFTDASSGICPEVITRTWRAEDDCGNVATCVQTITVNDDQPPVITCPADVNVNCGDPTFPTLTGFPTATDDCSGVTVTYSDVLSGDCPEILSRTWQAEDDCGNVATCVQTITIGDDTPPVITCPANVNLNCGDPTDPTNTGEATATDDCSTVTITFTDATSGVCPEVITRTWEAEDACGNVAACVQTITLNDNQPPVITCPGNVSLSCGDPTDPTNTGEATATDDCSSVTITYSDNTTGGCTQTIERTWTAEDDCGNVATCVQTITLTDDTPPVITCPANVSLSCGDPTDPTNTGEATATDDCSGVTITFTDASSGICPEVITRTWQAEDDCGNVATCVQTITVNDDQPPVITCPADVNVNCGDPTFPTLTGFPTATDDCSGVTVTYTDVLSGDCPEILSRTWQAEDDCGNIATCVQTITIGDDTPPVITCPANVNLNCGDPTDPTNTGEATATDDCSTVTITFTDATSGVCPEVITRTWAAEDDCGNVATCVQTITMNDNQPPVITCPADISVSCGEPIDPANTGEATATDDCSGVTITYSDNTTGGCTQVITRTWMAEDDCGNVATCVQTITRSDDAPPIISCPANVTVSCGDPTDPANTGEATATDDCGMVTITFTDATSGVCPEVITRTWQAEDDCGNVATCIQTISVNDDQPPVITCPANITVSCGDPTFPTLTGFPTATDDCSGVTVTYSDVITGGCTQILSRTWQAEDDCGNVATCVQTISIEDNQPPVITCPADVTLRCGDPTDPANTGEATATDDCSTIIITFSDAVSGVCPEVITRTWEAEDSCGNVATCIQTISVNDDQPPIITCPANVTVSCGDPTDPMNTGEATAADDCSMVNVSYTDSRSGVCPEVISRTWQAEDDCGNIATCIQTISVNDDQPPVITCPADISLDCGDSIDPNDIGEATATDDCSMVTITYSDNVTGGCTQIVERTWTAEDDCGNIATCVQVITLEDNSSPVITCPADITIECGDPTDPANTGEATATDDCSMVSLSFSDVLSGACPQVLTRTWTAMDDCGNMASCDQVITIDDNTPPDLTCPSDVTIDCNASTDPTITGEPTFDDACSAVSVTFSDVSVGVCPEVISRTWVAEDDCGNTSTCVQRITKDDSTPPAITCPADVSLTCGDPTDPSNTGEATATDDCSTPTIMYSDMVVGGCTQTITRTWTAEDDCGNVATCVQLIIVADDSPPEITCPADVTVSCGDPINPGSTGFPTATDDCSGVSLGFMDVSSGGCNQNITRTWTATDDCGNSSTCIQIIRRIDDTPPMITCPPDLTLQCSDKLDTDTSATGSATHFDDCTSTELSFTDSWSGLCPNVLERTFVAIDECGNSASCVQVISVYDTIPPTIMCPPDVTVFCRQQNDLTVTGEPKAEDSCPNPVTITYRDSLLHGECPGAVQRTFTVTDQCGNSATCTQIIDLIEFGAPSPLKNPEGDERTRELSVEQNDPNPWYSETSIEFDIPMSGLVKFTVLDANGKVEYDLTETFTEGKNEIIIPANTMRSAGVKFYTIESGGERIMKRMIFIR